MLPPQEWAGGLLGSSFVLAAVPAPAVGASCSMSHPGSQSLGAQWEPSSSLSMKWQLPQPHGLCLYSLYHLPEPLLGPWLSLIEP